MDNYSDGFKKGPGTIAEGIAAVLVIVGFAVIATLAMAAWKFVAWAWS